MFTPQGRTVAACGAAICLLAAGLVGKASAASVASYPADKTLRVLILSGPGGHDWRATTSFLRQILTDTGRFDVRVCEGPAGPKAQTLANFDVLVDASGGSASRNDPEGEIARFVESGKGLVITYGALAEEKPGTTAHGLWPASSPGVSHPPVQFADVRITRPEHAITQWMPIQFKIADALPRGLVIHPGAEVLATARDEINSDAGNSGQPILLASHHGNGRVFCTAMGHDLAAMQEPAFIATLRGEQNGLPPARSLYRRSLAWHGPEPTP